MTLHRCGLCSMVWALLAIAPWLPAAEPVAVESTTVLRPGDPTPFKVFGSTLKLSGEELYVSALGDGLFRGAIYVFSRNGVQWTERQKLTPPVNVKFGLLGKSFDLSGNLMVAGSPFAGTDGVSSGAAFLYERRNGVWTLTDELVPDDRGPLSMFGWRTLIVGDQIIVTAPGHALGRGTAYVFQRVRGQWKQVEKLAPGGLRPLASFGSEVSGAQGAMLITALGYGDAKASGAGTVYAYEFDRGWHQRQILQRPNRQAGDLFGLSTAVAGDWAMIGAPQADDIADNGGAVDLYRRGPSGWTFHETIADAALQIEDRFGFGLDMHGTRAVIGADFTPADAGTVAGRAEVFELQGDTWMRIVQLPYPDGGSDDFFGFSVAIEDDHVVVGARFEDVVYERMGAAYVFKLSR
ncbi:MAG: FG-GAP repeat protein [Planctomycetaceae bacterium]|nr:FG-GAP repeat protein [Planctomycetaceae bacterium]